MTSQMSLPLKQQMRLKELRPIVLDYLVAFPGWQFLLPDMFARENGPILQYIGFERVSGGAYRPECGNYALCVPNRGGGLGLQFLYSRSVHCINPRTHERLRDRAVDAMRKEFVPKVDAPLVPEEMLEICEQKAIPKPAQAHSLAALNAYLGHEERALYWCSRFTELVEGMGLGWAEWDIQRRAFLNLLVEWIEEGEAKERLERILQEERKNWGLK